MGKIYQVMVYGVRGEKMIIDLCSTEEQMQKMTVQQLRQKIVEKLPEMADNLGFGCPTLVSRRDYSGNFWSYWEHIGRAYEKDIDMRMIFTDKILDKPQELLSAYGIQNLSTIQLIKRVTGGGVRRRSAENLADFWER